MKPLTRLLLTTSILGSGLLASPAFARQAQNVDEPETIIIRAQRRAEDAIDVPAQVTALSPDDILANDVLQLEDLGNRIPNTFFGSTTGYATTSFSIRGIGGTISTGGEEPVAVFFDDQFIPRSFSSALMDLESIEVLRGPQATLYGRNATAGAVLLRSARPDLNNVTGFARVQVASFSEERYEAAVSAPIIEDKFAVRFAALYNERDGWVDNLVSTDTNVQDLDQFESGRVRGSFLWTPTDRLEIYGNIEYSQSNGSVGRANLGRPDLGPGGNRIRISEAALDELREGNFAVDANTAFSTEDARATLSATYSFDTFDVVAAAGYYFNDIIGANDSDGTAVDVFSNDGQFELLTYTQDVRAYSTHDGRFDWLVGFSAIQDRYQMPFFEIRNTAAVGGAGLAGTFNGTLPATAYAIYGELGYDVTDRLRVTVGARGTQEEKDADINQQFFNLTTGGPLGPPVNFVDDETFTAFTPRGIVEYALTDAMNVYGSISTGFKSGGYNVFAAAEEFDEEHVLAYEIGAKGRVFDNRLDFATAAFFYDYTDLQLRLGVPEGGVIIQNAADAQIYGFEAEGSFQATNDLSVFATLSLLETEIQEYVTRDLSGNLIDAEGSELARAPNFQISFGADYERPIGDAYFGRVGGVIAHRGEVFFLETDQDADTFLGEALTELDFRLTFGRQDQTWQIAGFVQNALDDVEATQIELQGNFPQATFNEPRKFGVELLTRF